MKKPFLTIAMPTSLAVILNSCSSIPTKPVETNSPAEQIYPETMLSQIFHEDAREHGDKSGFILLRNSKRAFRERIYLADIAEQTIDAQYYIWNSDIIGKSLMRRLVQSADRGVRVRLILDDFCVSERSDKLLVINSHPNIEVRVYNPFVKRSGASKWLNFAVDFDRLNRRMHNKTYIVDGTAAIVGGRNIGDEYFGQNTHINFRDLDLFAIGPVVKQVAGSFQGYWDSPWAIAIDEMVPSDADQSYVSQLQDFQKDALSEPAQAFFPGKIAAPDTHFNNLLRELVWAPATFVHDWPGGDDDQAYSDEPKQVAKHLLQLVENS